VARRAEREEVVKDNHRDTEAQRRKTEEESAFRLTNSSSLCLCVSVSLWLSLAKSGDAAVAHDVMLHVRVRDHVSHLKLAQNLRRPNAVRPTFADSHITDAHKVRGRRHHDLAVDEGEEFGTTPWGKSQLKRDAMVLLSKCVHNLEELPIDPGFHKKGGHEGHPLS